MESTGLAQLTDSYVAPDSTFPVEPLYAPAVNAITIRPVVDTPVIDAQVPEARPEPRPEPMGLLDNFGMAGVADKSGKSESKLIKKLFGLGGEERYQLWPEKVVRDALGAAGEVAQTDPTANLGLRREDFTDIPAPSMPTKDSTWLGEKLGIAPVAAQPNDYMVDAAQSMAALAGSGGLAGTTDATLGAGPFLRPALKYDNKIYKAPLNGQHLDALPAHLQETFHKQAMSGEDISHFDFGFMNHKGQFLSREAALDYAIKEGLVDPHAGQYGALTSTLLADSSKPGTAIEAIKHIQPAKENLRTVADSNFKFGKVIGDRTVDIKSLKGGVTNAADDLTRVNKLAEKMKSPDGYVERLIVDQDGNVLEGQHRLDALRKNGASKVPVTVIKDLESGVNTSKMREAIKAAGVQKSDQVNQLIRHVLELNHAEKGNIANILSYEIPGFEKPFKAAVETLLADSSKPGTAIEAMAKSGKPIKTFGVNNEPIYTIKDKNGNMLAEARLSHTGEHVVDLHVAPEHRRQGIATNLYNYIEKDLGKKLKPSPVYQTEAGQAFWNARNKPAQPFYSALEHNVNQITQSKMTGDQWLGPRTERKYIDNNKQSKTYGQELSEVKYGGKLGNAPGVKPEELEWTGLADFLRENKDKIVSKEQIQEHLASNKLELKEVDKGAIADPIVRYLKDDYQTTKEIRNSEDIANAKKYNANFKETVKGMTDEEILKAAREAESYKDIQDTKYHSYQLPGGSNYREKLLTLPGKRYWVDGSPVTAEDLADPFTSASADRVASYGDNVYKSSHWDEPNILAHVRMNDRFTPVEYTAEEKAALAARQAGQAKMDAIRKEQHEVAKEIQKTVKPLYEVYRTKIFDDIKAGRISRREAADKFAEGYNPPEIKPLQDKLQALRAKEDAINKALPKAPEQKQLKSLHLEEIQSDWHQQGRDIGYKGDYEKSFQKIVDAERKLNVASQLGKSVEEQNALMDAYHKESDRHNKEFSSGRSNIPDAPFKKTWHELALKRMIREAAEKGYDRLSWTPGEAQAARYDLSKEVRHVYLHNPVWHGENDIRGSLVATGHNGNELVSKSVGSKSEIADLIGKEAAEKLVNDPTRMEGRNHVLQGDGLKVGGEGMKGFYDQIIPKSVNRIAKEYGAQVKTGKTKEGHDVHYIDLPQKLKDVALHKGFPLFSAGVPYQFIPVDHNPFEKDK